jgi:hypothetical protein
MSKEANLEMTRFSERLAEDIRDTPGVALGRLPEDGRATFGGVAVPQVRSNAVDDPSVASTNNNNRKDEKEETKKNEERVAAAPSGRSSIRSLPRLPGQYYYCSCVTLVIVSNEKYLMKEKR